MQVPLCPLSCGLMLQPAAFLSRHLPSSVDSFLTPSHASQASFCPGLSLSVARLAVPGSGIGAMQHNAGPSNASQTDLAREHLVPSQQHMQL